MPYTPAQLHATRVAVMTLAHSLRRANHWPMSTALRLAWKMARGGIAVHVAGVTFGNRQEALRHLAWYPAKRKVVTIKRVANAHDSNAVAVYVTVIGKGTVQVGFLPRHVAVLLAPLMDKGLTPEIADWEVIRGKTLGIALRLHLLAGTKKSTPMLGGKSAQPMIAIR